MGPSTTFMLSHNYRKNTIFLSCNQQIAGNTFNLFRGALKVPEWELDKMNARAHVGIRYAVTEKLRIRRCYRHRMIAQAVVLCESRVFQI